MAKYRLQAGKAIERGKLATQGKTKRVWEIIGQPDYLDLENTDAITKFDDPLQTQMLKGKGALCTATTCRVFELLLKNGAPCAYVGQSSDTSFIAPAVTMIPLEVVMRNKGVGSWRSRNPQCEPLPGSKAIEFKEPVFELFLKTTGGRLEFLGKVIVDHLSPEKGEEDPWIIDPFAPSWQLRHPKKSLTNPAGSLGYVLPPAEILGSIKAQDIEQLARKVNRVLAAAWKKLGYDLIDFKIELGITSGGQLVVADVIDADSWRLWDEDGNDFSKQSFRDGKPLQIIKAKYQRVAELVQQFAGC